MTDWPKLAILFLTYERMEFAEVALRSALDNIHYSGPLSVHIGDDGSTEGHRLVLKEIAGGYSQVQSISISDAERGGYGRNYNLATQTIHPHFDIILPLEDDWELMRKLDLDPLVRALNEGKFGCIRLGYLGWTQPLYGQFITAADQMFLLLDGQSPERHIFAGHPRLETKQWEKEVGPWSEGLTPNQTEFMACALPGARVGVVWPVDLVPARGGLFVHIGAYEAGTDRNFPKEKVAVG